jgi:hypothetical protein
MKYLKMLALTAVAAGALMAFIGAGTASASVICSTNVTPCPAAQAWPEGKVDFSLSGSASLIAVETGETLNTCTGGTVKGTHTPGSATKTATLDVEELTWTGCNFPTTTTERGTLEVHALTGGNGTVTAHKFKVDIDTILFGHCVYGTGETLDLGEITEGKPPTFHVAVHILFISGGFACPRTTEWDASYKVTEPPNTTGAVVAS